MSIIAVAGVPLRCSLKRITNKLKPVIKGHFETLNFGRPKLGFKNCYIALSDKLDPVRVVESINSRNYGMLHLRAFIPEHVPDLQISTKVKVLPNKVKKTLGLPANSHREVGVQSFSLIMREMQCKYTGLYALSQNTAPKGKHRLLNRIGKIIFDRINQILDANDIDSCFVLTKTYRKTHPHFGDFQMILSTFHQLQDAAGVPRKQIQESDLMTQEISSYKIDDIPLKKLTNATGKYSGQITNKILTHVMGLDTTPDPNNDPIEEAAKIRVREQLKKLLPFFPIIIKEVISNSFIPQNAKYYVVRIYGEPFLPGKEVMAPWVQRHRAAGARRDPRMYNLLVVRVARDAHLALLAADGSTIGGSKLVIRPFDSPYYKVKVDAPDPDEHVMAFSQPEPTEEQLPGEPYEWTEEW